MAVEHLQGSASMSMDEHNNPGEQDKSPSVGVKLPQLVTQVTVSRGSSMESLVHQLGLVDADEKSLGHLLKSFHANLSSALDEARTITTHDNNLEKQYKEVVAENVKLKASLERARKEITHLKGSLSVLELTSAEIREREVQRQAKQSRLQQQEAQLQQRPKVKNIEGLVKVLSFAERSRSVNCKGQYIESCDSGVSRRLRHLTYPPPSIAPPLPATTCKNEYLPPSLSGCSCSVCNSKQSLGALTLSKSLKAPPQIMQTKSGQQILLGDRVVVKGEQPGTIKYIGRLELDPFVNRVFIGVHLDAPVGNCDGMVKGKRYFQCPPIHGVFVLPQEVLCVTGRKPRTVSTTAPRMRDRLQTGQRTSGLTSRAASDKLSVPQSQPSTRSPSFHTQIKNQTDEELQHLLQHGPQQLIDSSVSDMTDQILQLQDRPRHLPAVAEVSDGEQLEEKEEEAEEEEKVEDNKQSRDHSPVEEPVQPTVLERETEEVDSGPSLEQLVEAELFDRDLGSTGFVTVKELQAALQEAGKLTVEQADEVITYLGLQDAEGRGIEYAGLAAAIANTITTLMNAAE